MPSRAMTSQIRSRSRGSPWPGAVLEGLGAHAGDQLADHRADGVQRQGGDRGHAAGEGDHLGAADHGEQGPDLRGLHPVGACCVPVGQRVQPRVPREDVGSAPWQVRPRLTGTGEAGRVRAPQVSGRGRRLPCAGGVRAGGSGGRGRSARVRLVVAVRPEDECRHLLGSVKVPGRRVGLGGQEQPLDGGEHGLGDGAAQPGVEQQQPVDRVREVSAVEPDGRHAGHPQQVPGLRRATRRSSMPVRATTSRRGEVGELLADGGRRPGAGAVVVAGHAAGVLGGRAPPGAGRRRGRRGRRWRTPCARPATGSGRGPGSGRRWRRRRPAGPRCGRPGRTPGRPRWSRPRCSRCRRRRGRGRRR